VDWEGDDVDNITADLNIISLLRRRRAPHPDGEGEDLVSEADSTRDQEEMLGTDEEDVGV
jgi:hypothetical protein